MFEVKDGSVNLVAEGSPIMGSKYSDESNIIISNIPLLRSSNILPSNRLRQNKMPSMLT